MRVFRMSNVYNQLVRGLSNGKPMHEKMKYKPTKYIFKKYYNYKSRTNYQKSCDL